MRTKIQQKKLIKKQQRRQFFNKLLKITLFRTKQRTLINTKKYLYYRFIKMRRRGVRWKRFTKYKKIFAPTTSNIRKPFRHYPFPDQQWALKFKKRIFLKTSKPLSLSLPYRTFGGRNHWGFLSKLHRGSRMSKKSLNISNYNTYIKNIQYYKLDLTCILPNIVKQFVFDPHRNTITALLCSTCGTLSYIIAPQYLAIGDIILNRLTNWLYLWAIAFFYKYKKTIFFKQTYYAKSLLYSYYEIRKIPRNFNHTIYNWFFQLNNKFLITDFQKPLRSCFLGYCRRGQILFNMHFTWGGSAAISSKHGSKVLALSPFYKRVVTQMPSKEIRMFSFYTTAHRGLNSCTMKQKLRKYLCHTAGHTRHLGLRPIVRGVAKNPIDHPLGGRNRGGKLARSPWGWLTKTNIKRKLSKTITKRREIFYK